ncbi:hypothetical protein [Micromonospora zhanjiangensis]
MLIMKLLATNWTQPGNNFMINAQGRGLVLVASGEVARSGLKIVSVAR